MLSHSIFTVNTYTGTQIPSALLKQYGRLRYACFAFDDPYVQMNHHDKTELDHFDCLPTTLYVVVTSKQPKQARQLVSAVRLIPTMEDYDLEQPSWRYLTAKMDLPKASNIVEGSRWVGKSSRTHEGALSTGLLMMQLYQLAQENAFDRLIGVVASKSEDWLVKRQASIQSVDSRHSTEYDGEILVTTLTLDKQFVDSAKSLILHSMEFASVREIAVAKIA